MSSCSFAPPTTAGRNSGRKSVPTSPRPRKVLAVGDLHVENFGTWRDIEGRLIWGVNDFDEAWPMAYTIDLVRLAVSAHLAAEAGHLPVKREDICTVMLGRLSRKHAGKRRPLRAGRKTSMAPPHRQRRTPRSRPLLAENGRPPHSKAECPISAIDAIEHLMPAPNIPYRLAHRVAGLGSLGHARYVAIADWHGGRIAREAKALVPSSSHWAQSIEAERPAAPPKSSTRPSSTAPSAVPIISSSCADAGSSAAWPPTAPASCSPPCVPPTSNSASSTPWDGKPPTSTSALPPPANQSSATWTSRNQSGCTKPPNKCSKPPATTGKSGRKKATPDRCLCGDGRLGRPAKQSEAPWPQTSRPPNLAEPQAGGAGLPGLR